MPLGFLGWFAVIDSSKASIFFGGGVPHGRDKSAKVSESDGPSKLLPHSTSPNGRDTSKRSASMRACFTLQNCLGSLLSNDFLIVPPLIQDSIIWGCFGSLDHDFQEMNHFGGLRIKMIAQRRHMFFPGKCSWIFSYSILYYSWTVVYAIVQPNNPGHILAAIQFRSWFSITELSWCHNYHSHSTNIS